jgi:fluoride ion exporter CrcB/FEX
VQVDFRADLSIPVVEFLILGYLIFGYHTNSTCEPLSPDLGILGILGILGTPTTFSPAKAKTDVGQSITSVKILEHSPLITSH